MTGRRSLDRTNKETLPKPRFSQNVRSDPSRRIEIPPDRANSNSSVDAVTGVQLEPTARRDGAHPSVFRRRAV